jgi:hypothetical protein
LKEHLDIRDAEMIIKKVMKDQNFNQVSLSLPKTYDELKEYIKVNPPLEVKQGDEINWSRMRL